MSIDIPDDWKSVLETSELNSILDKIKDDDICPPK
jgi:hypothetical protein